MAAEARITPVWAAEQSGFAAAWLASWTENGGKIGAHPRAGRFISFPLNDNDQREQRSVRRALMGMLDAAGIEARDAVFAAAAASARGA